MNHMKKYVAAVALIVVQFGLIWVALFDNGFNQQFTALIFPGYGYEIIIEAILIEVFLLIGIVCVNFILLFRLKDRILFILQILVFILAILSAFILIR